MLYYANTVYIRFYSDMANEKEDKKPTGVEPERVKIDGDWEDAMEKALNKKRPENGWPEEEKDEKKDE